jgi:hypothetical protein
MQECAAEVLPDAVHSTDDDCFVASGCISREVRLRLAHQCSSVGFSANILEVSGSNIMNFAQGEYSLVHDDLTTLLPPPARDAALVSLADLGTEAAFHTRRDLVNFKKICLHMQEGATHTCKDLKQLCAFFRTDTQSHESFFMPVDRYGSISDTMQECAGALDAVADGRRISKAMCCIPRLPDKPLSQYLLSCPQQLQCFKNACDAEQFLLTTEVLRHFAGEHHGEQQQQQQQHEVPGHASGSLIQENVDYDTRAAIISMLDQPWSLQSPIASSSAVSPVYIVAASMTARGGWKALRMQRVLHYVTSGLQKLLIRINHALNRLLALPSLERLKALLIKQREDAAAVPLGSGAEHGAPAVPDALAHHRVIVGCAIKRRRYISLLTGAFPTLSSKPPCSRFTTPSRRDCSSVGECHAALRDDAGEGPRQTVCVW